jgi:predicted membrane-bound spermidine synthase
MIFFLSGASALIFELLWFQLSGLAFGNSVWATAVVLAGFMGGLALGSTLVAFKGHKIKSPIRTYALLEIIIGISGFLLVLILPNLTQIFVPVFRLFLGSGFILTSIQAIAALLLMLLPACAMGATLPILVKTLYKKNPNFGRVLGILYGWNTFGAMAGVLVGELFLIKWLGIRNTGLVAASFNLLAAAGAITVYKIKLTGKTTPAAAATTQSPSIYSAKTFRLLFTGFLSGLSMLGLEIIWFRFMLLFFNTTSWNFAFMLAMVLLGISLGGIIAAKLFRSRPDAHRFLFPVLTLNGILVVLLYTNFVYLHRAVDGLGHTLEITSLSLYLIFPVSLLSGIIFTMLGKALHNEMKTETKTAGLLTLANTTGGMIGSLVAGFVLIPFIGIEKSFFLFALCYGIMALLVFQRPPLPRPKGKRKFSLHISAAAVYLIVMVLFPFGFMDYHYLKVPVERHNKRGERRVSVREGVTETIQYLEKDLLGQPYYYRLVTNSHSMSGTMLFARRYMKAFVYWPAAVHPNLEKALLICYGCGMTAKALTDTKSLKSIDIVDISRAIIEESSVVFPDPKENPVHDPRVKIHIEDGRFFLLTRKRHFDLITAEPPPPKFKGIENLYSREFFRLAHDRLADGGIVTYWLPVHQIKMAEAKSILKAFTDVFPNGSLWAGSGLEWMMMGVKNPGKPVDRETFSRQWHDPVVGPELRTLGFDNPEQLGAFFIADGERLQEWIGSALPLVDNFPKRLSPYLVPLPLAEADDYVGFMNDPASSTNFKTSRYIKRLWPASILENTEKYFASARIINELQIFKTTWMRYKDAYYINKCLHDPLLENYITWVLSSNQQAQDIISSYREQNPGESVEKPSTFMHLAAKALSHKNYPLAADYYQRFVDFFSRMNLFTDDEIFTICILRMYILFMAGDREGMLRVKEEYLDQVEKKQDKAVRDRLNLHLESYIKWLPNAAAQAVTNHP